MITKEDYLKAKAIVEEYEEQEYQSASIESLYCTSCQALEAHDCFCKENEVYCPACGHEDPHHSEKCPYYIYEDEL